MVDFDRQLAFLADGAVRELHDDADDDDDDDDEAAFSVAGGSWSLD